MMDLLKRARERGVAAALDGGAFGWGDLAVIRAHGPDTFAFLQSQLTQDVEGLEPGQSVLGARVTRTGHLVALFAVVGIAADDVWMVLPAEDADALHEDLDAFLFADKVSLERLPGPVAAVTGPCTTGILAVLGLPKIEEGGAFSDGGTLWLRRVFTGDDGLLVFGEPAAGDRVGQAAVDQDVLVLDGQGWSEVIDALRQEAGSDDRSDCRTDVERSISTSSSSDSSSASSSSSRRGGGDAS